MTGTALVKVAAEVLAKRAGLSDDELEEARTAAQEGTFEGEDPAALLAQIIGVCDSLNQTAWWFATALGVPDDYVGPVR
ncbi:MAG: hypothetical protein ACRDQW_17450 [Haloechinothrix sp.]